MTWAFKANFSDVRPAGSSSRRISEEGFYKVLIRDTEETTTKAGNLRALFRLSVAEGEQSGATETFGINLPQDEDCWTLPYWMVLLLSIGVSEDKLAKGDVNLTADSFKGKTGYLHYTPAPEGGYSTFKWMTKVDYEFHMKRAAPKTEEAPVQAAAEPAPTPAPATTVMPPTTQKDSGDPLSFLEI